jgi:hypothetical protein
LLPYKVHFIFFFEFSQQYQPVRETDDPGHFQDVIESQLNVFSLLC